MGLKQYICENCEKTFESYFDSAKYCSRECYREHKTKTKLCKEVLCPVCQKPFMQKRSDAIFCSVKCRAESTKKQVVCQCEYCGKIFSRKLSDYIKAKHRYCSVECKKLATEWSSEDDEVLRVYYRIIPTKDIIEKLSVKRDVYAIRRRAQYIGLSSSREWSEAEERLLEENYSVRPMIEMASLLPGRTRPSIIGKARTMNLLSYFYITHNYSNEEEKYLRENYLLKSNEELAKDLNRTVSGIAQHLLYLDLHRPTEINGYKNLSNYIRARLVPWRDQYKRDNNYTCAISGSRSNIVVHHIRGFNIILSEAMENIGMEIREEICDYSQNELDKIFEEYMSVQESYNQYICLSENIHKEFHKIYGYGNNTEQQWNEFLNNRQ